MPSWFSSLRAVEIKTKKQCKITTTDYKRVQRERERNYSPEARSDMLMLLSLSLLILIGQFAKKNRLEKAAKLKP